MDTEKTITKDQYQKLFLLYLINKFPAGAMGSIRLQKTVYTAIKDRNSKPFSYIHWKYGQYSQDLPCLTETLEEMGLIDIGKLSREGKRYRLSVEAHEHNLTGLFERIDPDTATSIDAAVSSVGMLDLSTLLKIMHDELDKMRIPKGAQIFTENLSDELSFGNLTEGECEDLELQLSEELYHASIMIADTVCTSKPISGEVETVQHIAKGFDHPPFSLTPC